jgi:hypothetical protein
MDSAVCCHLSEPKFSEMATYVHFPVEVCERCAHWHAFPATDFVVRTAKCCAAR